MAKKTAKPAPNDRLGARKDVTIDAVEPEQARRDIARLITAPEFAAARTIQAAEGRQGYGAQLDTLELVASLRARSDKVNANDLGDVERMLANQATALQSLFVRLAERGLCQTVVPVMESLMKLSLRAQAQCRATLETLANVKNPPVVLARQANIAQQQQVNNHAPAVPTRARELEPTHNELLESLPDERLDFGTQGAASGADSQLATVGTVHRPQD
jgi:hypothetical protein